MSTITIKEIANDHNINPLELKRLVRERGLGNISVNEKLSKHATGTLLSLIYPDMKEETCYNTEKDSFFSKVKNKIKNLFA